MLTEKQPFIPLVNFLKKMDVKMMMMIYLSNVYFSENVFFLFHFLIQLQAGKFQA